MNNVVRGVTSDTLITGTDEELAQDIDIHEIHVDTERNDQYTQDMSLMKMHLSLLMIAIVMQV